MLLAQVLRIGRNVRVKSEELVKPDSSNSSVSSNSSTPPKAGRLRGYLALICFPSPSSVTEAASEGDSPSLRLLLVPRTNLC
jgi:hypothetical protein